MSLEMLLIYFFQNGHFWNGVYHEDEDHKIEDGDQKDEDGGWYDEDGDYNDEYGEDGDYDDEDVDHYDDAVTARFGGCPVQRHFRTTTIPVYKLRPCPPAACQYHSPTVEI